MTKASTPQYSDFVGDDKGRNTGGGRGPGGRGPGRPYSRNKCHNCGKVGHVVRTCWGPGGGAEGQFPNRRRPNVGGVQQGDAFPGVDDTGMRNPPNANDPRERTLPNGQKVKWCGICGSWTDHYRAGCTG